MKLFRKLAAVCMALCIVFCLYTPVMAQDSDNPAGEYTVFAFENEGVVAEPATVGLTSSITLNEDGTGNYIFNDDSMGITAWKVDSDKITITMEDESSADGVYTAGVFVLDLFGDGSVKLFYAKPGADTSAYTVLSEEDALAALEAKADPGTMLYAFLKTIDADAGAHLNYDVHIDYMDTNKSVDCHEKGGQYISVVNTTISGNTSRMDTIVTDGKVYNLYPDDNESDPRD